MGFQCFTNVLKGLITMAKSRIQIRKSVKKEIGKEGDLKKQLSNLARDGVLVYCLIVWQMCWSV